MEELEYYDEANVFEESEYNDDVSFALGTESGFYKPVYTEGDVLLTSHWSQGHPYNSTCPGPWALDDCTAVRCSVGCVATAGAQIMRYWNWPPSGATHSGRAF